jgi:Fe-S-cluster containining protein
MPESLVIGGMQSSSKEATWLACKQKACCHTTIVPTGHDMWRIARGLDVPPLSFLMYFESSVERRDAFHLDQSGRRFRLALAHQPTRRRATPAPCIFLLRTRQGHHRCALGPLRPMVCRSYPAQVADGILYLDAGACTCGAWSLAGIDMAAGRALVDTRQAEAEVYCRVVAAWNARVATGPEEAIEFGMYCEYLLTSYDRIAEKSAEHA